MNRETDLLGTIFDRWKGNAAFAEKVLGQEKASFFVDVYNDAFEVKSAISDAYPETEQTSLICFDLFGLLKETHWLMVMFLAGNYPLLMSRLRFIWELIFRSLYVETYQQDSEREPSEPGPTLDDKHQWLSENEEGLGWNNLILPLLKRMFSSENPKEIESEFKPIWDTLNGYVHPSTTVRGDLIEESMLLVRDAFDENLAKKAIEYATAVFEIVWLAVLARFPNAKTKLFSDPATFRHFPRLRAVLAEPQSAG
jgi:hypothetical protein